MRYNLFSLVYSSLELLLELYWLGIKISLAFVESAYRWISPKPLKRLNTERILIIGSGRGLGRELTLQLSCHGAEVICWDVDEKSNQATVNGTRHFNGKAFAFTCDVTNRADVRRVAERSRQEVGEITMVIQCCGLSSPHALLDRSLQKVKQTFELSVLSHFWLLDEFLPPMLSSGRGHWVTLSSVAGLTGQPHHTSMAASQFAVQGLSEALSQQYWKKPNIHVTLVHIYPFLLTADLKSNIRLRISSYFNTMDPGEAARLIISGVRRNAAEISIPENALFYSKLLRLLPRKSSQIIRELLDTGVDFG